MANNPVEINLVVQAQTADDMARALRIEAHHLSEKADKARELECTYFADEYEQRADNLRAQAEYIIGETKIQTDDSWKR